MVQVQMRFREEDLTPGPFPGREGEFSLMLNQLHRSSGFEEAGIWKHPSLLF